jgi:hypothetical protein
VWKAKRFTNNQIIQPNNSNREMEVEGRGEGKEEEVHHREGIITLAHRENLNKCPAYKKGCSKCNKNGHYASFCLDNKIKGVGTD